MKLVHEILVGNTHAWDGQRAVIAFIQHGNREDGYVYENICPWCATSIEKVTVHPLARSSVVFRRLRQGMAKHIIVCPRRGSTTMLVERTTRPLGTTKIVKEV